jgi:hypothetical protein
MLFCSENVVLRAATQFRSSQVVVTFSERAEPQSVERVGFARDLLGRLGIDALFVTCRGNEWYQYAEMQALVDVIRKNTSGYKEVVTYGSSMGAYAAFRVGGQIDATRAVALSPLFSVDPNKVPWEKRWRRDTAHLEFVDDDMASSLRRISRAIAVVDPLHQDAKHARLLRQASETVEIINAPFAGHPTGHFLRETGIISDVVADMLTGKFKAASWPQRRRQARTLSHLYWRNMAERAEKRGRHALATSAAARAQSLQAP